mmetsp:Transcript_9454/g.21644  ORF Transcript_9454/g.21644 Transcript_9454/m.21644 type:complete len:710 (+) Transcript_9454:98-2227(+)|eukprot:CAMPEP_0177711842 /NCGR_PEP_ID=MMETSP0484_2-20121128/12079_1 /TAXON_ID=354590 /ORGANISM="Rhodomonas lens, Strain RHODO" /LENGTH=709 /DNA_ID=CAMNT_0019223607 /DNA_START=98 /DNA_END=2227 /DNA_ORIENTATION=+
MAQLQCSFKFAVGMPILPKMACVGKFDGKHPSLACGTTGNRVFLYSPHSHGMDTKVETRFLNINRELTALTAAKLNPESECDMLCVGSTAHILAFDVEENKDVYMKEVSDGVSAVVVGSVQGQTSPLCLVGGNCSIQGFDHEGEEQFWTVAGDMVGALIVADINGDGQNEVIIGSDDNEIRVVNGQGDVLLESTQTDKVVGLCHIKENRFVYALANGTVGMYEFKNKAITRKWRVKSKHKVCAIRAFDINGDNVLEIIIGWSNGRVEVRNVDSGEVLCKDTMDSPISAIMEADLRMDNRVQVIVCSNDGEVRGYVQSQGVVKTDESKAEEEEAALVALNQTKQELLCELQNYEDNVRHMKSGQMKQGEGQLVMVPVETDIKCQWRVDAEKKLVNLSVATNNDRVVRAVVIFADQLFPGESQFICPKEQHSELLIPLAPAKDVANDLFLKVFVGVRNGNLFYLKEQNYKMPRFSMYVPVPSGARVPDIDGKVTFEIEHKVSKVAEWLNNSFNIQYEPAANSASVTFISLRDDKHLTISARDNQVTIATENMELAGDLVQDLCDFAHITELNSTAIFPKAMKDFEQVVKQVDEYNASRLALAAESSELGSAVKELLVRAEDSRLLGDFGRMRTTYANLMVQNQALLAEHAKRCANQDALLAALKQVNQMIQRAARLRMGSVKSAVVSACRDAMKNNNMQRVLSIIQTGSPS